MASAEDPGTSCTQRDEADSSKELCHSETSKETSGPANATEENNGTTLSVSSNTSSKCDSNQDLEGKETSIDSSNVSGKAKKEGLKKKVKVVQSRYKASAAARNTTLASNSSGNSSSHNKSRANETLNAAPVRKKQVHKSKLMGIKPEEILRTKTSIPGLSTSTTHQAAPHHQAAQRTTDVQISKPRSTKLGDGKPSKPSQPAVTINKTLPHSTALNTTLVTDPATGTGRIHNNVLSSTFLNDVTLGGFKDNPARPALLELPDLSIIKPEGNHSGNRTVLSSVSEEEPQNYCGSNTVPEVTTEMLEQEYMKYLQWAYVDVSSEKAFGHQVREMQKQIVFLEQLVSEKQEEVSELKQKTDIIVHHQRASEAFDLQMKLLEALENDRPACEEVQKVLETELEKKLHQVKMENIYVPQDHVKYREELTKALNTQVSLLNDLEKLTEPQTQERNSTIKLSTDLQNISERVLRCEKEMQHTAGVAVEEASRQLGNKQMNLSADIL